jgi:hypothetical protein
VSIYVSLILSIPINFITNVHRLLHQHTARSWLMWKVKTHLQSVNVQLYHFQGNRKPLFLNKFVWEVSKFKIIRCTCTEIFFAFNVNVSIKMVQLFAAIIGVCPSCVMCLFVCLFVCLFDEAVISCALLNNQSRQQRRTLWMETVEYSCDKRSRHLSSTTNSTKCAVGLANIGTEIWTLNFFDKN